MAAPTRALLGALCLALAVVTGADAPMANLAWSSYVTDATAATPVTWVGISTDGTIYVKSNGVEMASFQLPTPSATATTTGTRRSTPSRTHTQTHTHHARNAAGPVSDLSGNVNPIGENAVRRSPRGKAGLRCGHGGVCAIPSASPSKHKALTPMCGHGGPCYEGKKKA